MIQPAETNYNHEVLSCIVNHMVLDLIARKSMEENFITVVDYSETVMGFPDKVRRLSLRFGGAKGAQIPGSFRTSQVRSLLFSGFFKCIPSIVKYRFLRVLILYVWADQEKTNFDLTRICDLFLLRYLKIACNIIVKLPEQMQRLRFLETLEVYARVKTVPLDIVRLQSLSHLLLPRATALPQGIGQMISLRTLGYFDLISNTENTVLSLGQMTNLNGLHLTCSIAPSGHLVPNMKFLGSIISRLSNLMYLTLAPYFSHGSSLEICTSSTSIPCDGLNGVASPPVLLKRLELSPHVYMFSVLPTWIAELGKLCILKIAARELRQNDINVLKELKALTSLSLYIRAAPEERIVFDKHGFQVLKHLKFICSAFSLAFKEGTMPNIRCIKLRFNANSIEQYSPVDAGFENLTGLAVFSAKIGGPTDDESCRNTVRFVLEEAFSEHPSPPIINIQFTDRIFYGDNGMSTAVQMEQYRTLGKPGVVRMEGSHAQYGIRGDSR
ncbi:hypothetical protein BAE44_0019306 [Dichanthelium oligosanthes]|uniref:Disease resistance R13L4/SHOC-2-like LRR domain-containing protein n=1 Tax=Dichanthelium oligosanthes TaxID=888268 RepID=A0A1E5V3U6_9POAL|nr:hypothetical protein BAE44_0019306 [Dichanthelium oligosanthes]